MNRAIVHIIALSALGISGAIAQQRQEIDRTTEKELRVVLNSSFGSVHIAAGGQSSLAVVECLRQNVPGFSVDYSVRDRIGYLDLSFGEGKDQDEESGHNSFRFSGLRGGEWSLVLSKDVPISFDMSLGVGRGDINLTGLPVKDLTLSSGASDVCLAFDSPNPVKLENINIETGVSKFVGRKLGNANFRHLRFQGGVGSCTLDFTGQLTHDADVDVEVGMGVVTIIIPWEAGARVQYEKNWVSRIDEDDDFEATGEEEYTSHNFQTAQGKMNIRIESGVGTVRIRRP